MRAGQKAVLRYAGGPAGISAVPGSGKTFTLSLLACKLIGDLARDPDAGAAEVLVVTFARSAAANIRQRIREYRAAMGSRTPGLGYTVCTLHSLANRIVRNRPGTVGLGADFRVLDESETRRFIASFIGEEAQRAKELAAVLFEQPRSVDNAKVFGRFRRDLEGWIYTLFREFKLRSLTPDRLASVLQDRGDQVVWSLMLDLYDAYQRQLRDLDAVDYTDLLRLAVEALEQDPELCSRLERKWPFVLEDEAQDSNRLQERIIGCLTRGQGNWVRVGDPNQSISTTFTGADAKLLPAFLAQAETQRYELPQSGRCARPILDAANHWITWSREFYRHFAKVDPLEPPLIAPTDADDPQPNPRGYAPQVCSYLPVGRQPAVWDDTCERMADLIQERLRRPGADTYSWAVLVPTQRQANQVVEALRARAVPVDDSLVRISDARRILIETVAYSLDLVVGPNLAALEAVWQAAYAPEPELAETEAVVEPEVVPGIDEAGEGPTAFDAWLASEPEGFDASPEASQAAWELRAAVRRWLDSVSLPPDEFVLLAAQDLFGTPFELAVCYCLAGYLGEHMARERHHDFASCSALLRRIASGAERIELPDEGGTYKAESGTVTVCTMHGAKGLEWDRVFLLGLNNYAFPADPETDQFMSRLYYVKDQWDLPAELMAVVDHALDQRLEEFMPGVATVDNCAAYVSERLRLLYVGLTRAREQVVLVPDCGRSRNQNAQAEAHRELDDYLAKVHAAHAQPVSG